jgi:N-acetylneuraminic acid mutarotase
MPFSPRAVCDFCAGQVNRASGKIFTLVKDKIRSASAALLLLVCVVALTSAFNLPNRSPDLSSRLAPISMAAKPAQQRTMLTLADRVAYQRAIEEVYWRHRIWPKERPDPKPSLDEVMPSVQLEKKVEDYLRTSEALEDYWQQPLSAEQLQAEMERMAQHTKQPEVLRELFEALGNDPFVIAECLARPALAERLMTNSYAHEQRLQSRLTQRAEADLRMPKVLIARNASYTVPRISGGPNGCTDDTWTPTSTANAPSARFYHTAVWTGSEMIVWGGSDNSGNVNTGGRYNPATDTWAATSTANAPAGRYNFTAVWTGTEMIVWGGFSDSGALNTGGRYNPSTDTWTATSTTNAPTPRDNPTAVWTGSEMIVWGGWSGSAVLNSGGRYDPGTDSWTATTLTNAPDARFLHTAVWTGNEMIVWGGWDDGTIIFNSGGRYNPVTNSWTATTTSNAPSARSGHTAVWTGSEMIVWGGTADSTGGRYNPSTNTWTGTSTTNVPSARAIHTAVWTGSEMIIWGGYDGNSDVNTGGRYNPGTDAWATTSTINAPSGRESHTAVWTGSEMIIWGGYAGIPNLFNTGGRYCAQSPAPMAQSAFSRKTHGAAGTFDIPLPLTGNVGIECRSGGATNDYQMIINFATTVTVGSASVTSGTGSVSSFSVSGSQVTVNLTGVTNVQRITVTLFNVNDGTHMGNVPASMGVLVGDVNGNAVVNASDVSLTKSQVGQPVTGSNFREDVNANGTISATDVALVKSKVGTALPP